MIITPPTEEPITLDEARKHLRVDVFGSPEESDDDDLISSLITAARETAEQFTGLALARATFEVALPAFPCGAIPLPQPPLVSITSIKYMLDDVETTADPDTYDVNIYTEPGWVVPVFGSYWPTADLMVAAVKVRYVAGYTRETCPHALKAAIKLILGALYENREDSAPVKVEQVPMSAEYLMRPYRIRKGMA